MREIDYLFPNERSLPGPFFSLNFIKPRWHKSYPCLNLSMYWFYHLLDHSANYGTTNNNSRTIILLLIRFEKKRFYSFSIVGIRSQMLYEICSPSPLSFSFIDKRKLFLSRKKESAMNIFMGNKHYCWYFVFERLVFRRKPGSS